METNRLSRLTAQQVARQSGMTLTEIMVVVVIMALIATGVALAVIPQLNKARIQTARSEVRVVSNAVTLFLMDSPGQCPAVDQLQLSRGARRQDPWDHDYIIKCEGEEPTVSSAGPDGQEGTEDDIH